jgi:hypothetical protein
VTISGNSSRNIDLSALAEGVYYLKMETATGTLVRKLVISR